MNINGFSHRGWILRDNLDLNHPEWTGYGSIGAYELYFQYKNGDWADLSAGNGYTMGQTGGKDSVIGTWNPRAAIRTGPTRLLLPSVPPAARNTVLPGCM